jgi:hypothetical protein
MLICFALMVPAFAWDAVRFYHGIAGPIVQFRRSVQRIAREQPVRPIKLRKTDQLTELQDDFNCMLETLVRHKVVTIVGDEPTAETRLAPVEDQPTNDNSGEDHVEPRIHNASA